MSGRSPFLDQRVESYLAETAVREHPLLASLRAETQNVAHSQMQIGADQAAYMQLLVKLLGVKRYLEVGVYTGYSSLAIALALPAEGSILACDISEEWTSIACRYWKQALVDAKIELRLAPALETLDALIASGAEGTFDLAFIDADKEHVDAYYERALILVRPGGLILVDNVLWSGRVSDPREDDAETRALRALNLKVRDDARVDSALIAVGDGLLMACKK
jgi:predicted O-methyltransferase YrrM